MTILGIDPGTATTGFGVIEKTKPGVFNILEFGVISTAKNLSDAERLSILAKDLGHIIKKYKPSLAGVEKLFFTSNQKTAITVAQARGIIVMELFNSSITTHEFTPLQIKNTICGYGKAEKKQVQFMVQKMFSLKNIPKPDDAADALAIALCAGLYHKK
jgi:crossover junction endodeoxyribonuclease RuvC